LDEKSLPLTAPLVDKRQGLTMDQFIENYESKGIPVILSGGNSEGCALKGWPLQQWTVDALLQSFANRLLKTNGHDADDHCYKMTLEEYVDYMKYNHDEKPLYLFDNKFLERIPELAKLWKVPHYFDTDLLEPCVSKEDRPDDRWFLIGPPKSGSPFHQDPHQTSAWNALMQGRKRWILYPPDCIPPGVDEELIDSDYYAAPEVLRWFIKYFPDHTKEVHRILKKRNVKEHQVPMEVIQEAGEVIFVPSGWWHQVVNLETTVAITQNFCSPRNFKSVMQDLLQKRHRSLRRLFLKGLQTKFPNLKSMYEPYLQYMEKDAPKPSSDSDSDSSSSDSDDMI